MATQKKSESTQVFKDAILNASGKSQPNKTKYIYEILAQISSTNPYYNILSANSDRNYMTSQWAKDLVTAALNEEQRMYANQEQRDYEKNTNQYQIDADKQRVAGLNPDLNGVSSDGLTAAVQGSNALVSNPTDLMQGIQNGLQLANTALSIASLVSTGFNLNQFRLQTLGQHIQNLQAVDTLANQIASNLPTGWFDDTFASLQSIDGFSVKTSGLGKGVDSLLSSFPKRFRNQIYQRFDDVLNSGVKTQSEFIDKLKGMPSSIAQANAGFASMQTLYDTWTQQFDLAKVVAETDYMQELFDNQIMSELQSLSINDESLPEFEAGNYAQGLITDRSKMIAESVDSEWFKKNGMRARTAALNKVFADTANIEALTFYQKYLNTIYQMAQEIDDPEERMMFLATYANSGACASIVNKAWDKREADAIDQSVRNKNISETVGNYARAGKDTAEAAYTVRKTITGGRK
ncbi:hypothetical protein [Capybara microvirus Cap3_SP_332]|nr:hypothetical protein [Capybara microvirus Cap3_SP_332]